MANAAIVADPEAVLGLAGTDIEDPIFFDDEPVPVPVRVVPTDPEMDVGSPRWSPKKYFGAQEKEVIVVKRTESDILGDPSGARRITIKPSINGYAIEIVKGVPTRVPRDFALHLVEIGAAYRYADIQEVV